MGSEVAIYQIVRLQLPDQIVIEIDEAEFDPALQVESKLRSEFFKQFLQLQLQLLFLTI